MSAGTFSAIGDVSGSVAIDQDDGLTITLTNSGGNLWTVVLEESIGNASWRLMASYSSNQSATVVTPRLGRTMIVRLRAATILTGDTIAYTLTRVSNQDGVTLTLEDGVPTAPSLALTSSTLQRQVVVTLTNAQFKAVPTTAIELLPAPGEGRAYGLVAVYSVLDTAAGAYTNKTNASPQVFAEGVNAGMTAIQGLAGMAFGAGVYIDQWPIGESAVLAGDFDGYSNSTARSAVNARLMLDDAWNGSDYTGGHANNYLKVTLLYVVLDTATGAILSADE